MSCWHYSITWHPLKWMDDHVIHGKAKSSRAVFLWIFAVIYIEYRGTHNKDNNQAPFRFCRRSCCPPSDFHDIVCYEDHMPVQVLTTHSNGDMVKLEWTPSLHGLPLWTLRPWICALANRWVLVGWSPSMICTWVFLTMLWIFQVLWIDQPHYGCPFNMIHETPCHKSVNTHHLALAINPETLLRLFFEHFPTSSKVNGCPALGGFPDHWQIQLTPIIVTIFLELWKFLRLGSQRMTDNWLYTIWYIPLNVSSPILHPRHWPKPRTYNSFDLSFAEHWTPFFYQHSWRLTLAEQMFKTLCISVFPK